MQGRKIVGQRIERLRVDILNLSQPEFAKLLGLDLPKGRSTVNNWEQGAIQVKSDDLTLISQKTGVTTDWLLGLADENNYSNDETVRLISEYTGLSTEAVKQLNLNNTMKERNSSCAACIDGVNLLLEDVQYGNHVLANISDYIREDYNGFLLQSDDKHIRVSNTVSLCKNGNPVHDFNIHNMKSVFLLWIQDEISKLHEKRRGTGNNGIC